MKTVVAALLALSAVLLPGAVSAQRGKVVSFTKLERLTLDDVNAQIQAATGLPGGVLGTTYGVDVYEALYETVAADGTTPITASGLVVLPVGYPCEPAIMTYGHGLCLKHTEVPSTGGTGSYALIGKGMGSNGLVAVLPDYIHMGAKATPGIQAFMHAASEASATIDLVRAARNFCAQQQIELSEEVFLSGYSQGGHSSMATARVMQTDFPDEFNVVAAAPGGGTYDLAGIAADSLASSTRFTPEPQALCLVTRSYMTVYRDTVQARGLPTDWWSPFKAPFDSILQIMLDPTTTLYNRYLLDSIPVRMLQDSFRIAFQTDPGFFIRNLLRLNSLYDWAPRMPMRIYHSTADIENPYQNVLFTLEQFQQRGSTSVEIVVTGTQNHPEAAVPHLLYLRVWFLQLRKACPTNRALPPGTTASLTLYPNPTTEALHFRWAPADRLPDYIQIFDATGRIHTTLPRPQHHHLELPVTTWPAGTHYVLQHFGDHYTAQQITVAPMNR
jgi:hypothetical protein